MVLTDLGSRLTASLRKMASATVIDDTVVDTLLKEICTALLEADVNIKLVAELKSRIKSTLSLEEITAGTNRRKHIHQTVFQQLCNLLDPKTKPFSPKKGRSNVIMFVGLQGAGKTTTVMKLAHYHKRKGWKVALVAADTFRAGAFDQLKQNAAKVKVPYYGSYTETDAAKVAADGVALFKKEGFDVIIVDTSGRHKQEKALFDEMMDVYRSVKPQEVIFVLDATIGQAAAMQAAAFKEHVPVGSVIITKLDGHAKGGGALSAVAQTGCPITFIGTGEHMHDLQPFDTQSFVRRLLGLGDISGLVETIKESGLANQPELMERLQQGVFTLRDMRDQLLNIMKAGPLGNLISMLPGMPPEILNASSNETENQNRLRRFMCIMDSMTDAELDSNDVAKYITPQRMGRIARGSGRHIQEVHSLLEMFKVFQKSIGNMGKMKMPRVAGHGPASSVAGMQQQMKMMQQMLDPRIVQQMGGMSGLQSMMRQFAGMDMSSLGGLLGGGGGLPGLGGAGGKGKR